MRKILSVVAVAAGLLAPVDSYSHHSFSAEFDVGRPVNLAGTLKRAEWTNPHAWLHMEVTDSQGKVQLWAVELLGVNALARNGMSSKTVKPGDKLTVIGYGARNRTNTANASSVNRTDTGETLWKAGAN
jgi:Family of unknown function (DUF6152)